MGNETALKATWTDRTAPESARGLLPEGSTDSARRMISRKALLIACVVLAFLAIVLNVALVVDLSGGAVSGAIYSEVREGLGVNAAHVESGATHSRTLTDLRNRLAILLGLVVVCGACLAYLMVGKVLGPIRSIGRGARAIASGRLDVTVPSHGEDEIAALGAAVNEIAANYQEVLLLTGTHAGRCLSATETVENAIKDGNDCAAGVLEQQAVLLQRELAAIAEVVQGFRFFGAHFNGREVVRRNPE